MDTNAAAPQPEHVPHANAPEGEAHSHTLVVKEGAAFLVMSAEGNIVPGDEGMGFYSGDTRHVSKLDLRLAGMRPSLLSSTAERVWIASVDLCNPALWDGESLLVPQMTVNVRRTMLVNDRMHQRLRVRSYHQSELVLPLELWIEADFLDLFEVRGLVREHRGEMRSPVIAACSVRFSYLGEDGVLRETLVEFDPPPASIEVTGEHGVVARYALALAPQGRQLLSVTATPIVRSVAAPVQTFQAAHDVLKASYEEWETTCATVTTGSSDFDELLNRGRRDLRALLTPTPHGPVYAAGIPWYVTVFGRDSIFAAFQTLMINPEPARNTLRCLAAYQGRQVDPWRDEEPGKILHEVRQGELAGAGYVPHTPYYGTVDATPLFCVLYGSYFRWTGDVALARELLPNAEAALAWIEQYGDSNGDGWVDYRRRSPRGLLNQGWKDSNDSVVHEGGRLAPSPIALAEVQAYVHLARLRMADVYDGLGRPEDARFQRELATELRTRFNETFWMPDKGYFAQAIDGEGKLVSTVTTNPAHGLYGGFIDPDKAAIMAERLLAPDMFSGWGIRTMSRTATAYNPISYHDGSIWPHDNAFIAAGLKRYNEREAANRVATAIVDAAAAAQDRRLPELFCGFSRDGAVRPVAYPVACAPQAWAAGAPFQLLQAMLGISARADEGMLTVNSPMLPKWLRRVTLRNIRVGDARLSLEFTRNREGDPTSFVMLERHGNVRVVMEE